VVKHIHYSQIEEIPIPMFSESLMKEVHQLIEESARLRTEAINRKKLAISKFQNYVGFKRIIPKDLYTWKNRSLIFRNKYTRLDSRYHSPDVYNILMHLKHKNIKCELLKSLTDKNDKGIFIPGRFKRNFVDSKNGLSYVTGADISKINPLENCKYLSIEYTKNQDKLLLKKGYILITCSGVIGNSYLVDQYLDSTIGTPDLIRIIPDSKKVKAGYLFAYFNTEIGKILIKRNTYGSVVPHIEAHHLFELPVPILDNKEIEYIHKKIIKSIEYNEIALSLEKKAISMVEEELN
jgi:type I restriction enzyme S subunit